MHKKEQKWYNDINRKCKRKINKENKNEKWKEKEHKIELEGNNG